MGLELTIQSLSQAAWPGASGRDRADPGSAEGRRRDHKPAGARTPEEALTHIELLSRAGRTDELAALLRSSQVFREAWQSLQQRAPSASEATGELVSPLPAPAATTERSGLPAPLPGAGSAGRQLSPVGNLALRPIPAGQESSPEIPEAQTYPVLSSRPTSTLAAARRVYETQARYYSQEGGAFPRLSLRV